MDAHSEKGATRPMIVVLALIGQERVVLVRRVGDRKEGLPWDHSRPLELPVDAAMRLVQEQTGYVTAYSALQEARAFQLSPTSSAYCHVVVATQCLPGEHRVDRTRFEPIPMSIVDLRWALFQGRLTTMAGAYLALDHVGLLTVEAGPTSSLMRVAAAKKVGG